MISSELMPEALVAAFRNAVFAYADLRDGRRSPEDALVEYDGRKCEIGLIALWAGKYNDPIPDDILNLLRHQAPPPLRYFGNTFAQGGSILREMYISVMRDPQTHGRWWQ